ncbi:uncharacterized protein LOC129749076 isoform X2 [Uranotaenia lowii]|uniref:uncharacterized protein LOC129749035 isoform X2 n=1 Tax=Uranotaenia lowii TaxID=190385 RepID=UPI0024789F3E|nr:uncharacterized protein LOC129749035 isoform X2 [Uranotaenia lowii]XP_055599898.1 uncharacterized protein LOC129749076 isoform X2 [Uranotaenia lowii]
MSGKRHCSFRTIVKCGARNRTHQNSARRAKSLLKVTDPDSAENGYSQAQATKARTTNPRHVPRSQTRPDQHQQHQVGRNEATRKVNSKRVAQSGPFWFRHILLHISARVHVAAHPLVSAPTFFLSGTKRAPNSSETARHRQRHLCFQPHTRRKFSLTSFRPRSGSQHCPSKHRIESPPILGRMSHSWLGSRARVETFDRGKMKPLTRTIVATFEQHWTDTHRLHPGKENSGFLLRIHMDSRRCTPDVPAVPPKSQQKRRSWHRWPLHHRRLRGQQLLNVSRK